MPTTPTLHHLKQFSATWLNIARQYPTCIIHETECCCCITPTVTPKTPLLADAAFAYVAYDIYRFICVYNIPLRALGCANTLLRGGVTESTA